MMQRPPARWIFWLLIPMVLIGIGIYLRTVRARHSASAVVRLVLVPEPDGWEGISSEQRRGIAILLRDRFDLTCPFPVLLEENLRGTPPSDTTFLRLRGTRIEDDLQLSGTLDGPSGQAAFTLPALPPAAELTAALNRVTSRPMPPDQLSPRLPKLFWELAELMGWTVDREVAPFRERAHDLVQRAPDCPAAWLLLAELDWRALILASDSDPEIQERCRSRFQKALELLPGYPRAAYNAALLMTDTGNQREAIGSLIKAIRAHPHVPYLRHGLAYAARTVGLLEGSRRALQARDRLQGPSRAGRKIAENTYLYLGDWAKFSESLGQGPDPYVDEVVNFYRGYLRLLQGDRVQAQGWFEQILAHPGAKTDFEALARVYNLSLQGQSAEALRVLDTLQQQRMRLRVPDGEFTFKLAEAYAHLGDTEKAMLMAERAYSQGFACTAWFEASPLLAPIRTTPRWRALHQHLKERQQLLETRFSASAFD